MSRIPMVDIGECSLCGGCIEVCPQVFRLNDTGFIEVSELSEYPEADVDEAIKNCPEGCISWEED
jgi:ferredoxin